ncbi:MAG: hypothetical protein ACI93R_003301 [Flavobacteriales bacterium]|jgi:hypothetical protein
MSFKSQFSSFKSWLAENLYPLIEFQQRIWVVSVGQGTAMSDTFIVSEDGFSEPLEWMKRKGYDEGMLERVEVLNRSEAIVFDLQGKKHYLLRVK